MYRYLPRKTTLLSLVLILGSLSLPAVLAADRVPGEHWMRFADPAEAGFDVEKLEAARQTWEGMPSSAFLVVADGAIVASWGEVERRFMCHSVRKSFLSGLYGIYWDRGEIDLNKTLADLGLDDDPDRLLQTEKRARILDLLKARSGVFHPAAYAGRTDSRPRGSEGPGRYFAYNNWDFNTLAAILEQETGDRVFTAFDEHFAAPLGMEDWRVSDGYYHFERDKSQYPAYPFRMSARDAARFGLLFARDGLWDQDRILSRHWVRRSSALYSIDNEIRGYGFMWWIYRQPRFESHGMFAALGVGNQMIAALPDSDLVIVNRANTYQGERTPESALLDLVAQVLEARTGESVKTPRLVAVESAGVDPASTRVDSEQLAEFVGKWSVPPAWLGLPQRTEIEIDAHEGHLVAHSPRSGTFQLHLQPDGSFYQEDSRRKFLPVRGPNGDFFGLTDQRTVLRAAIDAAARGEKQRSDQILEMLAASDSGEFEAGRSIISLLQGESELAEQGLRRLAAGSDPDGAEATVNDVGYFLLGTEQLEQARKVFQINATVFSESANVWDSLGEVQMALGETEEATRSYRRSLGLDPNNRNAEAMIGRMQERPAPRGAGSIHSTLMDKARIPGLTMAVIKAGQVTALHSLGVADAETAEEITPATLFEAASLSKPVFATAVLRLAERGVIDLDRPLREILPNERLAGDERYRALTPRIVLSHRTGLPNWGGETMELGFFPGTQFKYSGEGYVYLQKVVEKITGLSLDDLVRQEVFEPLGMTHSRFSWTEDQGGSLVLARPHDQSGAAVAKQAAHEDNAAASLHTTAAEYARFVIAWMGDDLLPGSILQRALTPAVGMRWDATTTEKPREVWERIGWGLGWGLQLPSGTEESEPIVWHWGDNGAFKAFVAFRPESRSGVVYFSNASNGLAIGESLVSPVVGDMSPTFRWLGYEAHDDPGFVDRIEGAEAAGAGRYQEAIEAYQRSLSADSDDVTQQRIDWLIQLVGAIENPITLTAVQLESYSGSYPPRHLSHHDGALYYQRDGRPERRLIPVSERMFAVEELDGFRLEIAMEGDEGSIRALIGHYLDGSKDESPREAGSDGR